MYSYTLENLTSNRMYVCEWNKLINTMNCIYTEQNYTLWLIYIGNLKKLIVKVAVRFKIVTQLLQFRLAR